LGEVRKDFLMNDIFERGYKAGQWTKELLKECGWHSAQECLERAWANYEEECDARCGMYPEQAARQYEYLSGVMAGARDSLRSLIERSKS
jgi:hypothetical protein